MVAPEMFYFTLLTCLIVVTSSDGTLTESSHQAFKRDSDNLISNVAENLGLENANSFSTFKRNEAEKINLDNHKAFVDSKPTLSKGTTEKVKIIEVDTIFKNECSNTACNQFDILEEYVDLVTSMNPVNYPGVLKEVDHTYVVDDYNKHLEAAKDHVSMWRNGNIKSGIRQTYESAKLFGPEFQRKYIIFQKKLKINSNSNHDLKKKENLLKDIQNIKDLRQNNYSEDIVSYMEQELQKKENELNELLVVERDLDEIITFLEFVKENADIIKQRAHETGEKMKIFKDFVLKDHASFIQSKKNAEQAIDTSRTQLISTLDQIEQYIKNKETEEEKHQHFARKITETEAKFDFLLKEKNDKLQEYIEKMNIKPSYASFKLNSWPPGVSFSLGINSEYKKQLTEVMFLQQISFEQISSVFKERARLNQGGLDLTTQQIYNLEDKILKLKTDINNIFFVNYYLEVVTEESERILPYINKALRSLKELVDSFDIIVSKLVSLITKAKEVKGPVEKAQFKDIFYIGISTMQTDWNNAYLDIICAESYVDADYYQETQPEE